MKNKTEKYYLITYCDDIGDKFSVVGTMSPPQFFIYESSKRGKIIGMLYSQEINKEEAVEITALIKSLEVNIPWSKRSGQT